MVAMAESIITIKYLILKLRRAPDPEAVLEIMSMGLTRIFQMEMEI